jgi:hypothetical protein
MIKKMRKDLCGPASFLRSLSASPSNNIEELKTFLCDIIIHTSLPLCISFQKMLTQTSTNTSSNINRYNQSLNLLVASLKCIYEWKECIKQFNNNKDQMKENEAANDLVMNKVYGHLAKILSANENFNSMLNLELLTKHLPKFDAFCDSILVNQLLNNADNQVILYLN